MRNDGRRVQKIWSRWRPISSLPLLSLMSRLGLARTYATSSIGFVETSFRVRNGLPSLWCFLCQLDNFMKTGLKVSVPLILGRTVLCDRYRLDLLVEGMADLHDISDQNRLGYKLLRFLPRPDHAFLIEVEAETAFRRKPDMPSLQHFVERTKLYHAMSRRLQVKSLDGTRSVNEIHQEIVRDVLTDPEP
jgi:hypothetical protein